MSFAIALFAAAATGRIAAPNITGLSRENHSPWRTDPLLAGASAALPESPAWRPDEVALASAVSLLWRHYESDPRQQAICSRLLAFQALLARLGGGVADLPNQGAQAYLLRAALSPAIVSAAATAPVDENGLFEDAAFDSLIVRFFSEDEALAANRRLRLEQSGAQFNVTEDVKLLSLHLFAFQSCVAADPGQPQPRFRTLEQLCFCMAAVCGAAGSQAMLSRVWRQALPRFPWLGITCPDSAAQLQRLHSVLPVPAPHEAMLCETALLGLLIELLRSLLGDAVTIQILRTLWPLAQLGNDLLVFPRASGFPVHHDSLPSGRTQ